MIDAYPTKNCETCVFNADCVTPEVRHSLIYYGLFTGKLPMPAEDDLHTVFTGAHNFLAAQQNEAGDSFSAYHDWMEANPGIMRLVDRCFDTECLLVEAPPVENKTISSTLDY